jgi:hypothetical protein
MSKPLRYMLLSSLSHTSDGMIMWVFCGFFFYQIGDVILDTPAIPLYNS